MPDHFLVLAIAALGILFLGGRFCIALWLPETHWLNDWFDGGDWFDGDGDCSGGGGE